MASGASRPPIHTLEAAGAALALMAALHFLSLRIGAAGLPGGDEGSWLSVAAELARGRGFTTRWLEGHFLLPYALPRPDDFRYPVLTCILALVFKIAGFSVAAGRWTVAILYLGFAASLWGVTRAAFGRWTGMAALWITCYSLLQLGWNSIVYTEGLFGLVVVGLAAWGLAGRAGEAPGGEAPGGAAAGDKARGGETSSGGIPGGLAPVGKAIDGVAPGSVVLGGKAIGGVATGNEVLGDKASGRVAHGKGVPDAQTANGNLPGWMRPGWWAVLGAGVGLLYLVRANGILFLPGIACLWWLRRRVVSWRHAAAAAAGFLGAAGPWMVRTALRFGNPLHVAGNAGLLREPGQSHTFSILEYFSQFDAWFPLKRMVIGCQRFFQALDFYEHGLWILPVSLIAAAAWQRRKFFDPFLATGIILTFMAAIYTAYNSWAGVRYMSGMLPLAYAYGLSALPGLAAGARRFLPARLPVPAWVLGAAGIAILLMPVLGPHRFYERKYAQPSDELGAPLTRHLHLIDSLLPEGGAYYAASLCKVNFLMDDPRCVGLQELYDSTWFTRSREAFRPGLIALTHAETGDSVLAAALDLMRARGYTQDTLAGSGLAVYLALKADTAATGFARQAGPP